MAAECILAPSTSAEHKAFVMQAQDACAIPAGLRTGHPSKVVPW